MNIEGIIEGLSKALVYLFMAGIIYMAWKLAYDQAKKSQKGLLRLMISGLLICVAIAFMANINLGSHQENCDDDPIYGRCDRIQDYEPTAKERTLSFSYYIILLYVPVALGIYKGSRE